MGKDPAFLFYYQDFLVGTSFMTLEETGAYIKLLCFQAAKGHLSEEAILKKIPAPIWQSICCNFKKDNNGFFNDRLEQEIQKRRLFTESRRKNLHMDKHMVKHMDRVLTPHMENENKDVIKDKYLDFVLLTKEEFNKLMDRFGKEETTERIARLNEYGHQKPKKFKEYGSHYHTILAWARKDKPEAGSNLTKAQKSNLNGLKKTMERITNDKSKLSTGLPCLDSGVPGSAI